MMTGEHSTDHAPTPIHHALDQVTILNIEIHRLRQLLLAGDAIDPALLTHMETALDQIAEVLLQCRDQADRTS
jgi:hypothetical protein